ncbi:HRDC domain-containing protein [Dehalogenimonas sp. THU2]|uniref:ribonuclease D n=1 Tax=Dehalogenimonas sp. THU2 TaxID=3151121 RepID=UPI00321841E5
MTDSKPVPVEFINQIANLKPAAKEMYGSPVIAVDTESNSRHYYPEQLCLIQIATRHKIFIIDTLALGELTPLKDIMADRTIQKVFHSADYDIRSLDRHQGLLIRNIYDTQVSARFTGITQFSLAALLKDVLGIPIEKNARLQKADWGLRPLSDEAIAYAADDVRYLLPLQQELDQRLQALDRTGWAIEECLRLEEVRYSAPDLETTYRSIKGVTSLDSRGVAIFKRLFLFREAQARRWHRPPFYLIPDSAMLSLAADPTVNLSDVPGIGQIWLNRFGRDLQQALDQGQKEPPINFPPAVRPPRPTDEQIKRLNRLREWRAALSVSLALDPSLIWASASLERLAEAPDTITDELGHPGIRRWQSQTFGASLADLLKSLIDNG